MHADLQSRLARLSDDLRSGQIDRAALFWLKLFAEMVDEGSGELRSDRWTEAGLEAARGLPGLAATSLAPRQQLVARYDLFRFVRLKDDAPISGGDLAQLDWQRKYRVGLLPEFAADLAELRGWTEQQWVELGGVAPEFAALEAALARYADQGQSGLIEALHDAQAIFGGWLPRPVVERVATALGMPVADVQGVIEFYEMFRDRPAGRTVIRVCQDGPCGLAGAGAMLDGLCRQLRIAPGETTPDGEYTVEAVRCLGLCDRAPAAHVNRQRFGPLDPAAPEYLLAGQPAADRQAIGGVMRLALANVGVIDPASLEAYRAGGGLAALHKAVSQLTPAQVIAEVKASKLVGRGGAAFPTGQKWQLTADNPSGPRYVICNADESEPGAFKDRVLLEGDPFRVLEGLIIACYAVGAELGLLYIRGEYPQAYDRLVEARRQLEAAGYLGDHILGSEFSCQIELRRGAGA